MLINLTRGEERGQRKDMPEKIAPKEWVDHQAENEWLLECFDCQSIQKSFKRVRWLEHLNKE